MERKRVGLALSGGVLRGAAHIGVLMALEEAGIPIDCVAGVSAGSIVGSLYCAGITTDQMLARSHELGWRKLASVVWPREGFVSFARLGRWLIDIIGDRSFSDLMCPFAVVVTDVATGVPVLWREGKVARAVHASLCRARFYCARKGSGSSVWRWGRVVQLAGVCGACPGCGLRHRRGLDAAPDTATRRTVSIRIRRVGNISRAIGRWTGGGRLFDRAALSRYELSTGQSV